MYVGDEWAGMWMDLGYEWILDVKTRMSICMCLSLLAVWVGAEGRRKKDAGNPDGLTPWLAN